MCGICGYSKLNEAIDKRTFDKMTDVVAHRGPDGRGVFYDNGVALGCLLLTYRPKRHSPLNIRIGMFAFSTVRFLIT